MSAIRLPRNGLPVALCWGLFLSFALAGCGGGGGGGVQVEPPPLPPWHLSVIDSGSGKELAKGKIEVAKETYRVCLEGKEPAEFNRKEISRQGRYVSLPVVADEQPERFRAKDVQRALRRLESSKEQVRLRSASGGRVYILGREEVK